MIRFAFLKKSRLSLMACFLCSRCFRCAWPRECSGCRVDSGLGAVGRSRQTSQGYRWVRVGASLNQGSGPPVGRGVPEAGWPGDYLRGVREQGESGKDS